MTCQRNMKNLNIKKLLVITCLSLSLVFSARAASAQVDVWGDPLSGKTVGLEAFTALGLGNRNPQTIIAAIVQIVLGFLGVLAVCLLLYGGFLWMTAAGDESKIDRARDLIKNAVIGLVIILSAFAIVTFVLRALVRASGASDNPNQNGKQLSTSCSPEGASLACDCGGIKVCSGGVWSACMGSDCSDANKGRRFCDANPLTRPSCEAKDAMCGDNQFCDNKDCRCSDKAGYGESCDGDTSLASCQADNNRCGVGLTCDVSKSCTCIGAPIIQALSPLGGFCQGDVNKACSSDSDCSGLVPNKCDQQTANGAVGNLLTINGLYFLPYNAAVSKVYFYDGSDVKLEAPLASSINSNCKQNEAWTDKQIVVVVPAGAKAGPIKIVAASGTDQTDNDTGYKGQVVINGLLRPGLCRVDPVAGKFDASVNYYGARLGASDAYFGAMAASVKADGQPFSQDDTGFAAVPNIQAALTTTFVRKLSTGLASNLLQFKKEADDEAAPVIIGFEPSRASAGAYVTIRGRGFGRGREFASSVYFGDKEASFDFPPECAASVWTSSQIVVKVPEGLDDKAAYDIKLKVGDRETAASEKFVYDKSLLLAPSLCRIDPVFAQPNDAISLWGEYFENRNKFSKVRFYYNQDQSNTELAVWQPGNSKKADFIKTVIPSAALTGPVYAIKNQVELVGNGLNLSIGQCVKDEECGASQVCCAAGTAAAGKCKASIDECYGSSDTCVFEWDFATGTNNGCPSSAPNLCDDSRCCASKCQDNGDGKTVCADGVNNRLACAGFANALCLDSVLCPNSPGNCSLRLGVETKGMTCDCNLMGFAGTVYDAATNRCVNEAAKCSAAKMMPDIKGVEVPAYCANYLTYGPRWHLKSNQTCPEGFTKLIGKPGICVNTAVGAESCELCAGNLTCSANGVCSSPSQICPNNFECSGAINGVGGTCSRPEGTCECCCDKRKNDPVTQANPACCSELTCGNTCGAGTGAGGEDYGSCSGCANVGSTQAEHDNACNCSTSTGKFCDMTNSEVTGGICRDCGAIGDSVECSKHDACCVDQKNGRACAAVVGGNRLVGEGAESNLNFCAYFGCADNCTASLLGDYPSATLCTENCSDVPDLEKIPCDRDAQTATCEKDNNFCQIKLNDSEAVCNDKCLCEGSGDIDKNRPNIEDYGPVDDQVCRNPLIWVNFDRSMMDGSFANNVLLIGDYGSAPCPAGTSLLAWNNQRPASNAWYAKVLRILGEALSKVMPKVVDEAAAASEESNYCLVQSRVKAVELETQGGKKSRLVLEPKSVLSPETRYYVVIRGDEVLDAKNGVKDVLGNGFIGQNLSMPLVTEFNGLSYANAQIWQFSTVRDICSIDRVEIDPKQVLFAAPNAVESLVAEAKSSSGQSLVSTAIYSFSWLPWLVENPDLAKIEFNRMTDGLGWEPVAKVIAGSKTDGQTVARASLKIDYDGLSAVSTAGEKKVANARLIFFYCNNPWPPIADVESWPLGWWDDTANNAAARCDVGDGNCLSNDFQIYYCRDQARPGTLDDLPALAIDPVVRANYFFGSGNEATEVLKDIYFFRELNPVTPTKLEIGNDKTSQLGGAVRVKIVASDEAKRYRIYYGQTAGKYSDFVMVDRAQAQDELVTKINNLANGKKYYFTATAVSNLNIESPLMPEQEFLVADESAPIWRDDKAGQVPLVSLMKVDVRDATNKKIIMNWTKEKLDVTGYNLGFGPNMNSAVKVQLGNIDNYVISGLNNLSTQDYYVRLQAFDKAGNKGEEAVYLCEKGCAEMCDCQKL